MACGEATAGLRVLQVGVGGWGASWVEVIRRAPGVELAAVVDASAEARRAAVDELSVPADRVAGALGEALAAWPVDAVVIVSPPATHHDLALEALEAGRHVLVEKPLATSLPDALAIVDAAARAGRHALVSQNYRFSAPVSACRTTVAAGALGELVAVRVRFRRDMAPMLAAGDFRLRLRHPFVLDMAIHHLDLVRAITGQEVWQVHARSWPVPGSPFAHHPAMAALMLLESGAPIVYDGDWAGWGEPTSWNGRWELVGSRARLCLTGPPEDRSVGEVRLVHPDGTSEEVRQRPFPAPDRAGTLLALRDAVAGRAAPDIAAADNVRSLALTLACVESIERGAPVEVGELLREAGAVTSR